VITLPAEALLLPVARTPDAAVAASEWAADLTPSALVAASLDIDSFPLHYRRAIMNRLEPMERSTAWRAHFQRFLETHQGLTPEQIAVVQDAMDVASPEVFNPPVRQDVKDKVSKVFNKATSLLGQKIASELFVTLGPKASTRTNALPMVQRLADQIRSWRVAAADAPDCNCNPEMDTCDLEPDPWLMCSELYTCNMDVSWPMCGPLWCWACTGWCKVLRWPGGGQVEGGQ
jgi:hypothetical protein